MIKSIHSPELKAKLDNNEELILIDCREQGEWDAGHIKAAKFVALSKLEEVFETEIPNKDAQIIFQCRSGKRSLNACMFLQGEGYSDLTNLEGGILGWQGEGYEVVTD
jgi:rhodanese-related sulfurtransferase